MRPRAIGVLLALAALLLHAPRALDAHPLHTTITDLTWEGGKVRAVIRIFAEDFDAAVAGGDKPTYLGRHFVVRGAGGSPVAFHWRASRVTDGLLWITLEGSAPAGLRGATVSNSLAADLFSDQVNIVKASYDGQRRTLLFTRGAGPKKLS